MKFRLRRACKSVSDASNANMHKNFNGISKWQYKMQTDFHPVVRMLSLCIDLIFQPVHSLSEHLYGVIAFCYGVTKMGTPNFYANKNHKPAYYTTNMLWQYLYCVSYAACFTLTVIKIFLQLSSLLRIHTRCLQTLYLHTWNN